MKVYTFLALELLGAVMYAGLMIGVLALAVWVIVKVLQLTGAL